MYHQMIYERGNFFGIISLTFTLPPLIDSKYEYKGRRWKRISKAGKAFIDDLLVVDPDDRATDDEALRASWLNRRYSATVRNPIVEEMNLAKDSVLRYAKYSKIRQMALMGTIWNI